MKAEPSLRSVHVEHKSFAVWNLTDADVLLFLQW